jgi:hypothetical protein
MAHLIRSYSSIAYADLAPQLSAAHGFLVARADQALKALTSNSSRWGTLLKRIRVDLSANGVPEAINKSSERLVEVINMAATLERLMDGLSWFAKQPAFAALTVVECHPSTSSSTAGNDLVLGVDPARILVRCEVTDVASSSAGQNGKERKDLESLGCGASVPSDGVRRFVCTSTEFARALTSSIRKWDRCHYRYAVFEVESSDTRLLEVLPPPRDQAA